MCGSSIGGPFFKSHPESGPKHMVDPVHNAYLAGVLKEVATAVTVLIFKFVLYYNCVMTVVEICSVASRFQ